jgi:hypothetical protein
MDKREKLIDIAGKLLLCWFLFECVHFLYSGRFMTLVRMVPQFFQNKIVVGLYVVYQMTISTVGAFATVPLLLKGTKTGFILGMLCCLTGYSVNPFDLILPAGALLSSTNDPTPLSQVIDIIWLICTVAITILFFLQRRESGGA